MFNTPKKKEAKNKKTSIPIFFETDTEAASLDENVLPAKLSPTSELRKKLGTIVEYRRHQKMSQIRNEMDRYESFSTVEKQASVLSWWKRMTNALPILSEFARSVLAIPASSAGPSE